MINDTKFNGHDFPLDVNNERDDYKYALEGIDSLEDIAADNVVYIYKNKDKKIRRIEVGTDTQSGTVTNINITDGTKTIGGKVLALAPYAGVNASTADIGNEGTALLDVYGRLYDFQLGEASKGNFAVLVGAGDDIYTGSTGSASQYMLFDKTCSEVVYTKVSTGFKVSKYDGSASYSATSINGTNAPLVEYKLSGGKLESIIEGEFAETLGTGADAGIYGSVNKAGTILSVPKSAKFPNGDSGIIDSTAVLYVYTDDYTDVSLGNIKDVADQKFDKKFWYYKDAKGKIKALFVYSSNAGAQNVFVMINSLSDEFYNGTVKAVHGLNFATGASGRVGNYSDNQLIDKLNPKADGSIITTPYMSGYEYKSGRYATMVQFRMGEDGVLKDAKSLLQENWLNFGSATGKGGQEDVAIVNAILHPTEPIIGSTIRLATGSAVSGNADYLAGLSNWGTGNEYGSSIFNPETKNYWSVPLEPNAVLYKLSGSSWAAFRPSVSTLKDDDLTTTDLYVFLKTGKDIAGYDVIIKVR
jgi:hypothetical protein